jgi:hypothetical protein
VASQREMEHSIIDRGDLAIYVRPGSSSSIPTEIYAESAPRTLLAAKKLSSLFCARNPAGTRGAAQLTRRQAIRV